MFLTSLAVVYREDYYGDGTPAVSPLMPQMHLHLLLAGTHGFAYGRIDDFIAGQKWLHLYSESLKRQSSRAIATSHLLFDLEHHINIFFL